MVCDLRAIHIQSIKQSFCAVRLDRRKTIMALINLKNFGVTLGAPLFTNLNLTINLGDRLGLVAANGRGKTTLLGCLMGSIEQTAGDITRSRGLRVGYVEQDLPSALINTVFYDMVYQALDAELAASESWRVDVVLDMLEVPDDLRLLPMSRLSGGWQRIAMLARVWVTDPDMLLLDEPTNHLDLRRIGRLQGWLAMLPREFPVVISSHDRSFLDATTNRTLFLREDGSQVFALSYTRARVALDAADAADARRYQNDQKRAQGLRRQAAKLKNIGINSGSDLLTVKTKQLNQRADKIEDAARPAHMGRSTGAIRLGNSGTHAKALVTLDDASVCTPDGRLLFKTGKKWIERGDRIVLLGANGAGKTQFVSMVHRAILNAGDCTRITIAPSLALGFSDQNLSQFGDNETPLNAICTRFDLGDRAARSTLAGAGLNFEFQSKAIGVLSGGQRARLAMLFLRLARPNFYLLDEPTNHLDIEGQEALETELETYGASCLLVSHDRSFIRKVGNRFWLIDNERLKEIENPEDFFHATVDKGD